MPEIVLLDEENEHQNPEDVEYVNDKELAFGDVEYENMEKENGPTGVELESNNLISIEMF